MSVVVSAVAADVTPEPNPAPSKEPLPIIDVPPQPNLNPGASSNADAIAPGFTGASPLARTTTPTQKTTHLGSDHSTLDRKTQIVKLRGNAYLARDNEEVKADEIDYNITTQYVEARGRVQYQYGEYFVKADAIELDLVKKTGVITNGNLTNGQFALRGKRMEQVGEDRYLVADYDYTTCLDCPNSWEMTGKSGDITIDGYAFIKDFIFKVRDTPFFWLPYMIVPAKSRRQSGLLFPRFGYSDVYGLFFVQPAFWAINHWSDMTIGVGDYARRGLRVEVEGRYSLTKRSEGIFNFYTTHDKELPELTYRFAGKAAVTQELPFGFESKLKLNEVSDSGYPITYSEDIDGRYEPVLTSDFFVSKNSPNISSVISFRRIRNLLYFDQNNQFTNGFDTSTVQEFPRIVVNSNDQFLFGSKIATGVEARFNRFARYDGPFDTLTTTSGSTTQTIREANRLTLIPSLYTTFTPWPWLSVVPSVQYRAFYYNFNQNYPDLARGYLLAQTEMSVQLEKVFQTNDPHVTYRHTFRPILTYSIIPTIQQSQAQHPFLVQSQDNTQPGQYFDDSDIVPIGTSHNLESYFTPLGNSLTYGVVSQLYRKEKMADGTPRVERRAEFKAQQTLDIQEAKRLLTDQRDDRVILSPFSASLLYVNGVFSSNTEYTYYSFLDRYQDANLIAFPNPHRVNSSLAWTWEKGVKDGVLWFQRSVSLSYNFSKLTSRVSALSADLLYSINDYIMPEISYSLDLMSVPNQVLDSKYGVTFQSPSRCWRLDAALTRSIDRGVSFVFNFALNLTGSGFTTAPQ